MISTLAGTGPTSVSAAAAGRHPVGAPNRIAAALRRIGWRLVFRLSGGLSVSGRLPHAGCVVVAGHRSHADSAALIAALDAAHRPVVAAAADHWFRSRRRAAVCRATVAGFPVRRTGGGMVDLRQALPLLAAGHAVVVFAEGSRDVDANRFHTGAFRLALEAGVPVVPVAVIGTDRLLPTTGRVRRTALRVSIGAAFLPTDPESAARLAQDRVGILGRSAAAHTSSRPDRQNRGLGLGHVLMRDSHSPLKAL